MPSDVLVAILALLGTLTGTLGGIIVSSKLVNFRLEQLEKRVGEHNNFAMRIPALEEKIDERFDAYDRRLEILEERQ